MDGAFGSGESVKQELSIFDHPSVQVTHLKAQWLEIKPHNQFTGLMGNPILINITKAQGWYLDFNDSYLELTMKIVKKDRTAMGGAEKVAPINFVMGALFKDVSLSGGNQQKIEGEN
jgi:hypothetical protein